jgi:hypothetical protein
MGVSSALAVWLTVSVPLGLLVILRLSVGKDHSILAIIAGHDGRLSISRLQAFMWTMAIFGTYAAATAVHPTIRPASESAKAGARAALSKAQDYNSASAAAVADARRDLVKASNLARLAAQAAEQAEAKFTLEVDAAKKESFRQAAITARALARDLVITVDTATLTLRFAQEAAADAARDLNTAMQSSRAHQWVEIPATLLALAGISLSSGVFASLISAAAAKRIREGDPAAEEVTVQVPTALNAFAAEASGSTLRGNWLLIRGHSFGRTGVVRVDGAIAQVLFWTPSAIGVQLREGQPIRRLVIDSPNGKTANDVDASIGRTVTDQGAAGPRNLAIGERRKVFEFRDLFVDDSSPDNLSLMKFQMFGWTLVAVTIYLFIFFGSFGPTLDRLPEVDSTLVLLTGLSQAGYLGERTATTLK